MRISCKFDAKRQPWLTKPATHTHTHAQAGVLNRIEVHIKPTLAACKNVWAHLAQQIQAGLLLMSPRPHPTQLAHYKLMPRLANANCHVAVQEQWKEEEQQQPWQNLLCGSIPAPCNGLTLSALKAGSSSRRHTVQSGRSTAGELERSCCCCCGGSCEVPENSSIIKFERFCRLTKHGHDQKTGQPWADILVHKATTKSERGAVTGGVYHSSHPSCYNYNGLHSMNVNVLWFWTLDCSYSSSCDSVRVCRLCVCVGVCVRLPCTPMIQMHGLILT